MPSNKSFIPDKIGKFLARINAVRRSEAEIALDEVTASLPGTIDVITPDQPVGIMEIPAAEANFLAMQTRLLGRQRNSPMKAIDIGTFTGRSALAIAQAMPNGGKVISCDTNEEYTNIAKAHWEKAGVANRIDLRLAPAQETLRQLLEKGEAGTFDLVFIDADKLNYDTYYERALELLRPGGLIILDNMLWSGRVAEPEHNDPNTAALRNLNIKISADERVDPVLLGFEDGVMMIEKRDPHRFSKLAPPPTHGLSTAPPLIR